jgi:hypothetical protein
MGSIASPWHYDGAGYRARLLRSAMARALALRQDAVKTGGVPGHVNRTRILKWMNRSFGNSCSAPMMWGAPYVIHGGCSDDTFNDFRSSLISRGRACFERAIADPDSLSDEAFDETAWFHEGYQYAVTAGVKAVGGLRPGRQHPDRPSGEDWVEDDLRELFPRLSIKTAGSPPSQPSRLHRSVSGDSW